MGAKMRFVLLLFAFVILSSFVTPAYALIPCQCGKPHDQCTCFIQLGDKGPAVSGIISILKDKGYLDKKHKKNEFTVDVKQAVIKFQADNGLECTGWMDDETLDALLFGILPDPSVKYTAEMWQEICFVPTDGGIRYHSDSTCSGMDHPRMISRVNAERLGIEHCKKESGNGGAARLLVYSALGVPSRILPDSYYLDESDVISESSLFSGNNEGHYIGNKKSKKFHWPTCGYADKISEKNRIEFSSREEALGMKYEPCQKCNP